MNSVFINILVEYIQNYIANLQENDIPFEYYWLNKNHPECVVEDMSDYEIAYKYPLSGERLVLDCWYMAREYANLQEEHRESFIKFIDSTIKECLNKLN